MGRFEVKWLVIGFLTFLIAFIPAMSFGADQPNGQPFEAIWNELADHQSQIDNEASARSNADTALQNNIDREQASRIAADAALQSEIDSLENRLNNEGVIVGTIIMWSGTIDSNGNPVVGSTADTNWHICDGTSGTPDLRDRFIVGAGSSYGIGSTGGASSVTLSISQIPTHNHFFTGTTSTDGAHSHGYDDYWIGWDQEDVSDGSHDAADDHFYKTYRTTSTSGSHRHTVSGYTSTAGSGQSHENRPPYYALAFIMKVQ